MEHKDILEKLNEIAFETNWGTVERVNGVPKAVIVIQEAMEEIKRLREQKKEILSYVGNLYDDCDQRFQLKDYQWHKDLCEHYGVGIEKNE